MLISIIRKDQLAAFENKAMDSFIDKSMLFLEKNASEWCQDKSHKDKEDFIHSMIEFSHKYNIHREINIQKLMMYKITHKFPIPLSEFKEKKLIRMKLDENLRIAEFYDSLTSNAGLIPITLDDD